MIKDGKYYCDKCGKEIPDPENNNYGEDLYFGIKNGNEEIVHFGGVLIDLCLKCADDIFCKVLECFEGKQKDKLIKEMQEQEGEYWKAEDYKEWENEHYKEYEKE